MFRLFPSQYYFERENELKFIDWMFEKTRNFVVMVFILVVFSLIFLTVYDVLRCENLVTCIDITVVRGIILLFSGVVTIFFFKMNSYKAQKLLFWFLFFIIVVASYDTYLWLRSSGLVYIDSATQMLSIFLFMVVPFINVEHKLILGLAFMLGLLLCKVLLPVENFGWTMAYVVVIYLVSLIVFYRFDVLFRSQFKSVLEEKEKACIDPLTGTLNRKALHTFFKEDLELIDSGRLMLIGILDIDCFKLYNDTYGHLAGDKVLQKIGKALIGLSFNRVYRFGGEEFVFTWDVENSEDFVIPDICTILKSCNIPHKASIVDSVVTASVGIVTIEAETIRKSMIDDTFADMLIMKADDNLYLAKKSGRNTCIVSNNIDLTR